MSSVRTNARDGSPRFDDTANGLKNGMTSSRAMACNRRGAPVKLCKPAPRVDKNEPTKMTHSFGHAIFATTNFPPIDAPNLQNERKRNYIYRECACVCVCQVVNVSYLSRSSKLSTVPANNRTDERYTVLVVRMAQMVPIGMLFCASAKSPERFEPAIIPIHLSKKSFEIIYQLLYLHLHSVAPVTFGSDCR